jgi:hypothetical protein
MSLLDGSYFIWLTSCMTYNYNRYGKPHEELHFFCSLLVEHKSRLNERTCVETPEEPDHFL